jgi:hypothetical protein
MSATPSARPLHCRFPSQSGGATNRIEQGAALRDARA